jgi:riboflavin biosynthesis pyrimidine reductase
MRALLPVPVADDVDVHEHYAAGWVGDGGIRANMVTSVDGAVSADGLSRGLQTAADNRVFAALRDLADVVLVGASTASAENYGPARPEIELRARCGLAAELPIAVVTRSLRIDTSGRLFDDESETRPFVVTCASSDERRRSELGEHAEVLVCGEDDIDYGTMRAVLAERGLTRVLCEGGPTLLGQVFAAGELDELCLSISPLAAGPESGRIVAGPPWPGGPRRLRLHGLLEEDGALFVRYAAAI